VGRYLRDFGRDVDGPCAPLRIVTSRKAQQLAGTFAARWLHFRGIATSGALVWVFNVWLVLTSSGEWVVVGLTLSAVLRRLSKNGILN
jgi:hypothetical protein